MLKIFLDGSKMNAVDDKNNLVGFDTSDDCCSHGGWFISIEKLDAEAFDNGQLDFTGPVNFPDYEFDITYFDGVKADGDDDRDSGIILDGDADALVRFKMVAPGKPDLYLHLYNCHNGYYSKGFTGSFGEIKYDGYL